MLESLLGRETKLESSDVAPEAREGRQSPEESEKQAALLAADRVANDEFVAVEFILQCRFADARLRAAEHIHTAALLQRVQEAMHKVDRRVAKLMQTRLDAIAKHTLIAKHAEACLEAAQALLQEVPLAPNRVAEMDRAWRSVGEASASHRSRFDALRAQMEARLTSQTALQRSAIDAVEQLRQLNRSFDGRAAEEKTDTALAALEETWTAYRLAPEFPSLPKTLVMDFEQTARQLKTKLASRNAPETTTSRAQQLAAWTTADPERMNVNEMKQTWARLLPAQDDDPSLQKQFETLIARLDRPAEKETSAIMDSGQIEAFADALQAMEQAIQEGHLHIATEKDDVLRKLEKNGQGLGRAQLARLNQVRAKLKRLQGWARWSGNISREELIQSVEVMPTQQIALPELAKAISAARERWKALDVQSGAASKALWERFDAACTTAYAPVAERLKKRAQERQQNRDKAEALIADAQRFLASSGLNREGHPDASLDWKRIARFYQGVVQSWSRIDHMDRKDQKRLGAAFDTVRQALLNPLRQQWDAEIRKREDLIDAVKAIETADRKAIDKVRAMQQRWQECAKAMPLEHKTEQALWQTFRTACDVIFSQRKATQHAADRQRKEHAERKAALCASLEAATEASAAAIQELLREAEMAWKKIGSVVRTREQTLDARYRKATGALHRRLKVLAGAARAGQHQALINKLSLCRTVEHALVFNERADVGWAEAWQGLPALMGALEGVLRKRFDAAIHALASQDDSYARLLEANQSLLQKELLRAEILAGVDSPPEFAQERLQVQVDVLRASLSGQGVKSLPAQIEAICALPALAEAATVDRMARLLQKFNRTVA